MTWIIRSRWLQNYAYHIPISGWVFVPTGMADMLIALLTVSSGRQRQHWPSR